jgi:hypothetical protein
MKLRSEPALTEKADYDQHCRGNYVVASKYLNYLDQTRYTEMGQDKGSFQDTTLIGKDKELAEKRNYLVKNVSNSTSVILTDRLLSDHPITEALNT